MAVPGGSRGGVTTPARHQRGTSQSSTGTSQGGPLASTPFVSLPVDRAMPLPLTSHSCRCGRLLNSLVKPPPVCVSSRCENAAARICREAGGRVRTNVLVRNLGFHAINNLDSRRLEVVIDGLSLLDTTLVSPLSRNGTARPRCATVSGAALDRARTRKERRYPELAGDHGRARLVVLAGEIGGRFSSETAQFLRCFASDKVRSTPLILKGRIHAAVIRRWSAMLGCSAARSHALSLLDKVPAGVDTTGMTDATSWLVVAATLACRA